MNPYHNLNTMYVESVILRTKDKEAMVKYYIEALGLSVIKEDGAYLHLGTASGRILVSLLLDPQATVQNGTVGLYHFALLLPNRRDLATFLLHYVETGYTFIGASDHSVSEALYLEDPEGNGIEIYVDRPDTEWKKMGSGVFMDTRRLDVNRLLQERDPSGFKTIPEDTIMGHIHLHVATIAKAQKFFVDTLGFKLMVTYGDQAIFTSDSGYHHHIGLNTWRNDPLPTNKKITGLFGYHLHVPLDRKTTFFNQLVDKGIKLQSDGQYVMFYDINGSLILIKED